MESARCTIDGRDHVAGEFAQLPGRVLEQRRRALVCLGTGCGGRAFFRSRSIDGRAACFGSNEHTFDCDAATPGPADDHGGADESSDEFANVGNRLLIDTRPQPSQLAHHDPDAPAEPGRLTPRHSGHGPDGPRAAISHKRLRPILRELLRSPAFGRWDRVVYYKDFPSAKTRWFFRPLAATTEVLDNGRRAGFWGTVVSAYLPAGSGLWLNVGPPGMCSVLIPLPQVDSFLLAVGEGDVEDLVGGAIIVLGQCRRSNAGKLYLKIADLDECAWLPFEAAQRITSQVLARPK